MINFTNEKIKGKYSLPIQEQMLKKCKCMIYHTDIDYDKLYLDEDDNLINASLVFDIVCFQRYLANTETHFRLEFSARKVFNKLTKESKFLFNKSLNKYDIKVLKNKDFDDFECFFFDGREEEKLSKIQVDIVNIIVLLSNIASEALELIWTVLYAEKYGELKFN